MSAEGNGSLADVPEACDQLDDCRFAAAGGAYKCGHASLWNLKAYVMQDLLLRMVAKRNIGYTNVHGIQADCLGGVLLLLAA